MKNFLIIYLVIGLIMCILCCIEDLIVRNFCDIEMDDITEKVIEEKNMSQDFRDFYQNLGFVKLSILCIPLWPIVIFGAIKKFF